MADLYLTIDDSPSAIFPQLFAFLKERDIPAVFFARGDLLSLYPDETIQAIKDGFVIANHSWSHHRASKLGEAMAVAEVFKTQNLIEQYYARAGVPCPGPYMRFPYMDAGLGGWPLPTHAFSDDEKSVIEKEYINFYGNDMTAPDKVAIGRFDTITASLRERGFRQMNFSGVNIPWYKTYAQTDAVSTQGTFCHPDWIMNRRYEGKIAEEKRTVQALNNNFDMHVAANPDSAQILVLHDSVELWPTTRALIEHMMETRHSFLPIPV